MRTIHVDTVPDCQHCFRKCKVVYDVPTVYQTWAYLCQDCRLGLQAPFADIAGARLERREGVIPKPQLMPVNGREKSSLEEVILGRKDRLVECPNCSEETMFESDAAGIIQCPYCGQMVIVQELV
jgi:DNA-directed RNA polymerase subunit RPC12/RpoP